jgi:antitoxin component of MazEF toxin-antitoxin module
MPAEEERKIMKHGTSGVVAIPIAYRRYHDLKTGTRVKVLYDSLLLIVPQAMEGVLEERRALVDELLGNRCHFVPKKLSSRKGRRIIEAGS